MQFINLKDLKANKGSLTLRLKSDGEYQEKEWNGKSFNVFKYEVELDGALHSLDATDALHRKLKDISVGDSFKLSYESFDKDGQLRHFWKIDTVTNPSEPVYESIKKPVNEFDEALKRDNAVEQAVKQRTSTFQNGARFGMVFNNVFRLYIEQDLSWTTAEFVTNFKRVLKFVEACEQAGESEEAVNEPKKEVQKEVEVQTFDKDDLPF